MSTESERRSEQTLLVSRKPLPAEQIYDDLSQMVHDTPLLEIGRLEIDSPRALVLAKMENTNPGGSVKDRIALSMIEEAERSGLLRPGGTVIEPTSGNTGIGLAVVCRTRGYRCVLTMPQSMSLERRQLLAAYGAELVLTPSELQMQGAIEKAKELGKAIPGSFLPHQFDNAANPLVHYEITAEELMYTLGGRAPDAFVAAVGTGGTVSGIGKRLKEVSAHCRVIAVEPESCATISRGEVGPTKIQGIGPGFVAGNYDSSVVDEVRTITDRRAYQTKLALARREGVLVGISAGANVAIALDVARELGPGHIVATMFCDTGERYFSLDTHFVDDES